MTIDFYPERETAESDEIVVDGISIPGVYELKESGGGIHEEYKTERASQSGGADTVDEPPAAKIDVTAWVTESTYSELNALREEQTPFEAQVGPFAYEQVGMANIEKIVKADQTNSIQVNFRLQEFREVTIQERNLLDQGGSSGSVGDAEGPPPAWTDEDGDGIDDIRGEPIPEMENVPLAAGQDWTQPVGTGESFGRKLVDATANGAFPHIDTNGENWAVQDIGIRGSMSSANLTPFNLTETGGGSLVQHIYLGDGSASGRMTGMWVDDDSTGDITFRYVNVAGFADNGIYASAPASSSYITIEDCYSYNNGISNYRLGNGEVVGCVSYHDGGGHGTWGGRGIYGWNGGPITVDDCDIVDEAGGNTIDASGGSGGLVNVSNSGLVGGDPILESDSGTGTVNINSTRSADASNYHSNVPGNAQSAAAGLENANGG